jgi:8-oxo-dGTP diphosphatase
VGLKFRPINGAELLDETHWALPGGFVRPGEDLAEAAARELMEETGVSADGLHLERLASYGAPRRDPRMRVITVAYLGIAPDLPLPAAGGDAAGARWAPISELTTIRLAFDHRQILADGVECARAKLEYTPLATTFCAGEFTVAELRRVYEIVWGTRLDARNFHRKVTDTEGFLVPTGRTTTRDGGRPAQLYRLDELRFLHAPMTRATNVSERPASTQ